MTLVSRVRAYLERARQGGHPLQVPPPATAAEVAAAQATIGFALPATLADLYLQVANGGFGPITALFGVPSPAAPAGWDVVRAYEHLSRDPYYHGGRWPSRLLPIIDCGCEVFYCIHCEGPEYPVIQLAVDNASLEETDFSGRVRQNWPFPDHPCRRLFTRVDRSFDGFFDAWLAEQERIPPER